VHLALDIVYRGPSYQPLIYTEEHESWSNVPPLGEELEQGSWAIKLSS
jgi:hypothetical protein